MRWTNCHPLRRLTGNTRKVRSAAPTKNPKAKNQEPRKSEISGRFRVSGCFETQFGPVIAEHWRRSFPDETESLRATGALEREADKLAVKAAFDLCSLRQAGVTRGANRQRRAVLSSRHSYRA